MKTYFNKKGRSVDEIKENFNNYLIKNNKKLSDFNINDIEGTLLIAAKNKNINNLKTMEKLGISLKEISFDCFQDSIINLMKHENYKEYIDLIVNMGGLQSQPVETSKDYPENFCLLSCLIDKKKKHVADYLIDLGYSNRLRSISNIISYLIEDGHFKKATELLKENKYNIKGIDASFLLPYVNIYDEIKKDNYISFVNEMMNNSNVEKDESLINAIWISILTNPLLKIENFKNLMGELKKINKDFLEKTYLFLEERNEIGDINLALKNDYPEKINFLKDNFQEENYNKIISSFIPYMILHPDNNRLDDIVKNHELDIILLLKDSKESIKKQIGNGSFDAFDIYNKHIPDNNLLKEMKHIFIGANFILKKGTPQNYEKLMKYYTSPTEINDMSFTYGTSTKHSVFMLLMRNNNKKRIEILINKKGFDLSKNLTGYLTAFNRDFKNPTVKKELIDEMSVLHGIKNLKNLKIEELVNSCEKLGKDYSADDLLKDVKLVIVNLEKDILNKVLYPNNEKKIIINKKRI